MKIEAIKNQKNFLEFVIKGERHTFPSLLKSKLLEDNSVEFVSYKLEHPMDKDSVFVVKTKGKTAKKALTEACKEIGTELEEFNKSMKKAMK
ncbi:MAG: RpoL/Rpb11 RNA polymerase subunit family protein [archaeon]